MNLVRVLLPLRIAIDFAWNSADLELDPLFTMFYAYTRNPPITCFCYFCRVSDTLRLSLR